MPPLAPVLSARTDLAYAFGGERPRQPVDWAAAARDTGLDAPVARMQQVHGAVVREVSAPGDAGEADALFTRTRGLLLAVVTADCVPVLVAGDGVVAVIHAGWRGIAAGVIPATLARLSGPLVAAIGPCVSAASYETGDAVIEAIVAAGVPESEVARRQPEWPRAHTDVAAAAAWQCRAGGCVQVDRVGIDTRTDRRFASFRRDGERAGRNVSLIGLRP